MIRNRGKAASLSHSLSYSVVQSILKPIARMKFDARMQNAGVTSSHIFQISHAVFFPQPTKDDDMCHIEVGNIPKFSCSAICFSTPGN